MQSSARLILGPEHRRFEELVDSLAHSFGALIGMEPLNYGQLPKSLPTRALYLYSEGPNHLYIGRTNRLKQRLSNHCRPSSTHHSATFAFRIAREMTGRIKATYAKAGSRAELIADPDFHAAFMEAKRRVADMDIRFVEEPDPVRQTLLEVYVAVVLNTPYNDFETH
jgi:hypothetical protein